MYLQQRQTVQHEYICETLPSLKQLEKICLETNASNCALLSKNIHANKDIVEK